jgi:hypothetical protein
MKAKAKLARAVTAGFVLPLGLATTHPTGSHQEPLDEGAAAAPSFAVPTGSGAGTFGFGS